MTLLRPANCPARPSPALPALWDEDDPRQAAARLGRGTAPSHGESERPRRMAPSAREIGRLAAQDILARWNEWLSYNATSGYRTMQRVAIVQCNQRLSYNATSGYRTM